MSYRTKIVLIDILLTATATVAVVANSRQQDFGTWIVVAGFTALFVTTVLGAIEEIRHGRPDV